MTEIITVTGNIGTEPEQRSLGDGASVTSFRVASPHRRFDRSTGAWVEQYTNWYTVSAFRALGAHAYSSLHRGDRVVVTGRLRLREWESGGKRGVSAEIDADAIGHDLLFGTTVYARSGGAAPADQAATATVPAADADGWALPAAPAEPALAGVDETPF